jgi:RecJ-like exonuclease
MAGYRPHVERVKCRTCEGTGTPKGALAAELNRRRNTMTPLRDLACGQCKGTGWVPKGSESHENSGYQD